ncbi:MAG: cbb3-type cytochrome c oxidase subunit II [Verrucomicrobiales bacterium]
MNKLPLLFLGIFLTFLSAWVGLVVAPIFQIGQLSAYEDEDLGVVLPPPPPGLAEAGRRVYVANGCIYCHSQQIRPEYAGADMDRGWGVRRTMPRDYIYDRPHLLGTMRTGPDLSSVGRRLSDKDWHHVHLYAPQMVESKSIMPPFRHLYEVRKIRGERSSNALELSGNYTPPEGYEVVPTAEAEALVEYLVTLDRSYALPEAPVED